MSDKQQQQQQQQRDEQKRPSWDRSDEDMNPVVRSSDDDIGEETTRRIGGTAVLPQIYDSVSPQMADPHLQAAFQQKGDLQQRQPSLKREKPSLPGTWVLKEIPTLPEFHPLERTAVFVPHADPPVVSARISGVLRDRSIEAKYDDDKAKVKCVTPDGVDFRVRLYRGRGPKYEHGIIVEVQRRFGCSVNFFRETTAILDAAEGKAVPPPPLGAFGTSNSAGAILPMVSDSEDDYSPAAAGSSSLEMVAKMLSHPGYDSHYLAYQTLVPLTDHTKMGLATARGVSRELLMPGNPVGDRVFHLVQRPSDVEDQAEDVFKLRTMAMTVLANAIQATKGNVDEQLREVLRPALIAEMRDRSESNPRSAQMAAQCVEYLLDGDHDPCGYHDALEKAREVGAARHAGLERQAQRCLDKLKRVS